VNIGRGYEFLPWNNANLTENAFFMTHAKRYLGYKLTHYMKLNIAWRTLLATNGTAFAIREHAGHTTKFSLESSLQFDTRDRPILPQEGVTARGTAEVAALLGDSSFIRLQGLLQAAAKLPYGAFINGSFETQLVQNVGHRTLHVLDRTYLGGPCDVRGFQINSIGPRADNCALGGAFSVALAAHLFYPLFPRDIFFAHAFASGGSTISVRSRNWLNDAANTMRCSAGVGLAAAIRNGIRFELNYVVPLASVPGDQCQQGIYFGAGVKFL